MKLSLENLIPLSGKLNNIYRGVIENNDDSKHPDGVKRGRCQIRIFGLHTPNKQSQETQGIPTEHLTWAEPVYPITEGSVTGLGVWSVPVQGSHVYVFFESGNINQPRYFASVAGVPKNKADAQTGFNDPAGKYPLEALLGEADFNRLARDITKDTYVDKRKQNLIKIGDITEPDPYYGETSKKYPNNIVFATHGGHIFEIDNTDNGRRFNYYHPSNSYLEFSEKGHVVFRNQGDRYNLVIGDEKEFVAGQKYIVLTKDEKKTVVGNQTYMVNGAQTLACAGKPGSKASKYGDTAVVGGQQIMSQYTQQISCFVKQDVSCVGSQTMSAKLNQDIACWANGSMSAKGNYTDSFMGKYSSQIKGMATNQIIGLYWDGSFAPHFLSSPVRTELGYSPCGSAVAAVNSGIEGITGALRDEMQPLLDAMNTIQGDITKAISDAVNSVNEFLKPVTDVINTVQKVATGIQQEYNYAKQLITTVQNLPQTVVGAVLGKINTIVNMPGTLINSTIGQIGNGITSIAALQSLSKLYSTANSFGFAPQVTIPSLTSYMSSISQYTQFNLSSYQRSGFASYSTDTGYVRDYGDGYSTGVVNTDGTLATEMDEMNNFVNNSLSATFMSPSGVFDMNAAIDYVYMEQSEFIINYLLNFTVNELLQPLTLADDKYPEGIVDADTLNSAVGGYFIDPAVTAVGPDIPLTYDAIGYSGYSGYYDPEGDYIPPGYTTYTYTVDNQALLLEDLNNTIDYLIVNPPSAAGPEFVSILQDAENVRIPTYAVAVSLVMREQSKTIFSTLLDTEDFVKESFAGVDYGTVSWEGKFDDWIESGFTWPTSALALSAGYAPPE